MKIVIVGGGTAGWLAALMIKKIQANHSVTVIESSKIDIIGAGEGSTGFLTDIVKNISWDYGCNESDFLRETNATPKLGIKHKDWSMKGKTYYGPIDNTYTSNQYCDYILIQTLLKDLPAHTASPNGYAIEKQKSGMYSKDNPDYRELDTSSYAYHFDAFKVGQYFKKIVLKDGVICVDAEVEQVLVQEKSISGLKMSSGETIVGDFYIDCTGFARKLISALGIKWKSYQKHLPVNSAMPFLLSHDEDSIIEPVTTAWAQSSGWIWQIPTQERYGCGYVYDDRFISDEQAHQEIERAYGRKIEPLRIMKYDTGRSEKLWHKNCLTLGLASAFVEPLEATSIHSTIVQLQTFLFDCLRDNITDTINEGVQQLYNKRMSNMYDSFKDFLVLHYQTSRRDSEFWKWIGTGETRTDFVSHILELSKVRLTKSADFDAFYGYAGAGLWNWVLIGLGHFDKEKATQELKFWNADREMIDLQFKLYRESAEHTSNQMINNTLLVKNILHYI